MEGRNLRDKSMDGRNEGKNVPKNANLMLKGFVK